MDNAPQPQTQTSIHADPPHDFITHLPQDVKEIILLKLPIKDVVRTSILSRKWVDTWVSIPYLVFEQGNRTESALIQMVDMVLLSHQGPILKFKLCSDHACNEAISRWLLILSRNGIKDLELTILSNARCKIPFHLISCIGLERLSLCGCSINIPSYFQGFMKLRTLMLSHCDLSGISLENMVSSCPLLDDLELHSVMQQGCFHIRAPNLTCLEIHDGFHDICLDTPKLDSAIIEFSHNPHQKFTVARDRKESNIIRTLGRLSNIRELVIDGAFFQYLATGPIAVKFPAIFNHLTDLDVWNVNTEPNEISAALCLFQNAPNLENLFIQFMTNNQPNVDASWKSKANQDHLFKKLKVVQILYQCDSEESLDNLQVTKSVLEFARLVLTTSPLLEKLNFTGLEDGAVTFDMLNRLPKSSKNAEISLYFAF